MTTAPTKKAAAPPAAAKAPAAPAAQQTGDSSHKNLQQHLAVVQEPSMTSVTEIYEFLESTRALLTSIAFSVTVAGTQLGTAARRGARENKDGRLTLVQKAKFQIVLRQVSRALTRNVTEDLLSGATGTIKAYGHLQEFLDGLESDTVARPHRSAKGGISLS